MRSQGPATLVLAALTLAMACMPAEGPPTASETALRVFELARQEDPDPAALNALFGNEEDADRRADLYDALERLGEAGSLQVTTAEPLEGLGITAVDLVGNLPGGGTAAFSVQLESTDDGSWRVAWLMGPGVDWPPRRRGRGTGLSTSGPPTRPAGSGER